jgi:geranylgeranyl diphosphate synthase, type I
MWKPQTQLHSQLVTTLTEIIEEQKKMLQPMISSSATFEALGFWELLQNQLSAGKLARGLMVVELAQLLGFSDQKNVFRVAAALEIFGTALLVHDDGMDLDRQRRGQLSVFGWYEQSARQKAWMDATHFGLSMAVNVGDILFFMTNQIISELELSAQKKVSLQQAFSQSALITGFGQMKDMVAPKLAVNEITASDVMEIYKLKTAHYTFCLPWRWAAILGDQSSEFIVELTTLGELVGQIFQLRDDELGLFGDEKITGKSTSSDLQAGKKTMYLVEAAQYIEQAETKIVESFKKLGVAELDADEVAQLKKYLIDSGVVERVAKHQRQLITQANELIDRLSTSAEVKKWLQEIVLFSAERVK